MTKRITYRFFCSLLTFCVAQFLYAQDGKIEKRILFLLDGSSSMNYFLEGGKQIEVARNILNDIADSLNHMEDVEMALRVYGHQSLFSKNDCLDTKLEVPFGQGNASEIRSVLGRLTPKGITPIAYSLQQAAADFPNRNSKNVILLITDGEESCAFDLCEVAKNLKSSGANLETFIIGFGLDGANKQNFDCVGKYFDASNFTMLRLILTEVIKKIVFGTTAQVNLNDANNLPSGTNVGMTFYLGNKTNDIYDVFHARQNNQPDSFAIAAFDNYKLTLHTNPPIHDELVNIIPSQHNVLDYSVPQGEFIITCPTRKRVAKSKMFPTLVQPSGDTSFVYHQRLHERNQLLAGKYDLDILTLPHERWENFSIEANQQNIIEVDEPGELLLTKRFLVVGGIFHKKNKRLEKIYALKADREDEKIYLQPGEYTLIYKPKFNPKSSSTKRYNLSVRTGEPIKLNL